MIKAVSFVVGVLRMRIMIGALLVIALLSLGCQKSEPKVGDSKTNWLRLCSANLDCVAPASCLCGVCTRPCEDSCEEVGAQAQCTMPDPISCDTGGVAVCLSACEPACAAPAQCVEGACLQPPDPWRIEPPQALRLVRCLMPSGGGCVAGNEVNELLSLRPDGSIAAAEPEISGQWQVIEGALPRLELRFERPGFEPVVFLGDPSTMLGCYEGMVEDANLPEANTFSACLLD